MYAERLSELKKKSLTGRSENEQKKEPVTPKKRDILNKVYTKRINSITDGHIERNKRIKNLNNHIRIALNNINKKVQSENIKNEACQRLAENLVGSVQHLVGSNLVGSVQHFRYLFE